jgi:hypothetical protein
VVKYGVDRMMQLVEVRYAKTCLNKRDQVGKLYSRSAVLGETCCVFYFGVWCVM